MVVPSIRVYKDLPSPKRPRVQCTATAKHTGKQCGFFANRDSGSDKCKFHGGKTPIKHGLFSKFSKGRLGARILELQEDPNLTKLEPILAVTQALLESQLQAYGPYLAQMEGDKEVGELKPLPPDQMDALRKLAETAGKLIGMRSVAVQKSEHMVPIEIVAVIIDKFVAGVNQHVQDVTARQALLGTLREVQNFSITSRTH